MRIRLVPRDQRRLVLEPGEDHLLAARRLTGIDAKASRMRPGGIDDRGEALLRSLRVGGRHPRAAKGDRKRRGNRSSSVLPDCHGAAPALSRAVAGLARRRLGTCRYHAAQPYGTSWYQSSDILPSARNTR
jgi:hypothetical protein